MFFLGSDTVDDGMYLSVLLGTDTGHKEDKINILPQSCFLLGIVGINPLPNVDINGAIPNKKPDMMEYRKR